MPPVIPLTISQRRPAVAVDDAAAVRTDTVHVVFTTPRETLAAVRVAAVISYSRSRLRIRRSDPMLDLAYLIVAAIGFALLWAIARVVDRV